MRIAIYLFINLFLWNIAFSQNFNLLGIDNSSFPIIKLNIELNEKDSIQLFKIIENESETKFEVDSITLPVDKESFCFLIDISKFKGSEKTSIFNAISTAVSQLNTISYINICYLVPGNEDECLIPLSFEFSENSKSFIDFMQNLKLPKLWGSGETNLNYGLIAAMDFVNEKDYLSDSKNIILITRDLSDQTQVYDILNKSEDFGENGIHLISNLNDTTKINSSNFYRLHENIEDEELTEKIVQSINKNDLTNLPETRNYIFTFKTEQDDELNTVEIQYLNQTLKTSFTKPIKNHPLNIIWFLIVLAIFVGVVIYVVIKNYQLRQKIGNLKETVSLLFDKKLKILGKQTEQPIVEIRLEDQLTNYHISKLTTTIGRKKSCDIFIDNLTISSHHASITNEGGEFYIKDHESTNGVFVNDLKVDKTTVKNGDVIRLGKAILSVHY